MTDIEELYEVEDEGFTDPTRTSYTVPALKPVTSSQLESVLSGADESTCTLYPVKSLVVAGGFQLTTKPLVVTLWMVTFSGSDAE